MIRNSNELQKEYEREFSEFLIEKINYAGGSLQFQHLCGFLQQLRFEIRDAFGVTKPEFMKFLREHSKTFKIDSKGVVTVASLSTLNSDSSSEEEIENTTSKETLQPKIKNGIGLVFKCFPKYAIIKASRPINTYIFFTPEDYGAKKESFFTDIDLPVQTEVCFNAIHGHNDYNIKYKATKVWRHVNLGGKNLRPENSTKNTFSGEGIIKTFFPTVGFISVKGDENMNIFFFRSSIDSSINVGDHVTFDAEYISKEWQATKVIKKRKKIINEPCANSQIYMKTKVKHNSANEKIKDQSGRIYFNSKHVRITFGEKDSEMADGDICDFYFYGIKVSNSDIALEFSEGDNVKFDGVKSKNSGWKAILVWVGEKPSSTDINKKIVKRIDEICNDTDNSGPREIASIRSDLLRTKNKNSNKKINTNNERHKLSSKSKVQLDRPFNKNLNSSSEECHINRTVAPKMVSQKLSHKNSKYNESKAKHIDKNAVNISNHKKSAPKYYQKKSFPELNEIDIFSENNENLPIFKDAYSDISDGSETVSEENNELQNLPHYSRKFLKEDEQCSNDTFNSQENLKNETYSDKESDGGASEVERTFTKSKSSIKMFEAIDGKIINLYCKFGFIKSDQLEKDVEFVFNTFYLNGNPVEEDLKQVAAVGEIVKFNCFVITDDYGEIHQKVTTAWKDLRPSVPEIKPEEFILEHGLRVTLDAEIDYKCEPEKSFDATRSMNFNKTLDLNSGVESSLHNNLDDMSYEYPVISKSKIHSLDEHWSSDVQHERLSDKIFNKLKTYGFSSSDREVAFNGIQEIIDLVLKNSNIEESFNSSLYQDNVIKSDSTTMCSSCTSASKTFAKDVNTKDSEAQTIVTGEIIHTSLFTED